MSSPFENAVADELLAEIARQRLMHKEVQAAADVKPRAWSNYLIQRTRHIPMPVLVSIAEVLGMKASEVLERAEQRLAASPVDPTTAELEAGLSPRARRAVEEGRAAHGDMDPPAATRGDVDDGLTRSA